MEKEFVSFKIALALKELGFDEECLGYFDVQSKMFYLADKDEFNLHKNFPSIIVAAPLWQQAVDWFRKKYGIAIIEDLAKESFCSCDEREYHFNIIWINGKRTSDLQKYQKIIYYKSLYEAREQAILKCIELCQKK